MRRTVHAFVAVALALSFSACSDDGDTNPTKEAGVDSGDKKDTGTGGDGQQIRLDSGIIVPEGGPITGDAAPAIVCDGKLLGKACTNEGGECGDPATSGMTCLLTSETKGGVCACQCIPDNPSTPLTNEDTCPDLASNTCGAVELTDGSEINLCFQRCDPELGKAGCDGSLSCDPRSGASVGIFEGAVCAFHGCADDSDCPVVTSAKCQTNVADSCATGETCVPLDVGGTDGLCAKNGTCDVPSGLCTDRKDKPGTFTDGKEVGDPCKDDTECASNMRCEREFDAASEQKAEGEACTTGRDCCSGSCAGGKCAAGACTVHARNGYCYIPFCGSKGLHPTFQCTEASTCNNVFSGGLCMKKCDIAPGSDGAVVNACRGNADDKPGDYECRAWNNLQFSSPTGAVPAAEAPVCDFGDTVPCNVFATLECAAFGDAANGNPTNMGCRTLDGKPTTDPKDPNGFCLDDTTSAGDSKWPTP